MRTLIITSLMTLVLTLLSTTLVVPLSYAKQGMGVFKELNLSQEQKKKLKDIKKAGKESTKELRQSHRKLRQQLQEAMRSETSDEDLRKLNRELRQAEAELKDLKFEKILKIRAILNKEQREKFHELKAKKMKRSHDEWTKHQND